MEKGTDDPGPSSHLYQQDHPTLDLWQQQHVTVEERQQIEKDGNAYQNQEYPRTNLDGSHMRLEPSEYNICLIHSQTQKQEWDPMPNE